jgi:hypothetical protein
MRAEANKETAAAKGFASLASGAASGSSTASESTGWMHQSGRGSRLLFRRL